MRNTQQDLQGQIYEEIASRNVNLNWTRLQSDVIIRGDSDLNSLRNLRSILITLKQEFRHDGPKVQFINQKRDDFAKRLILIQGQIQGLMKRRINYSIKDQQGGQRILDYTNILNEKQNQLIQLEKKIQNLEARLRKSSARQIQLQNKIVTLHRELQTKEDIIKIKNETILSEVAAANAFKDAFAKIKKNIDYNRSRIGEAEKIIFDNVSIPQVGSFDIKADLLARDRVVNRSQVYQSQTDSQKLKTKLVQIFRQFQRFINQPDGINDQQVERILQGFLLQMNNSRLYEQTQVALKREKIEEDLRRLKENFALASGIYQANVQKLRKDNPGIRIQLDNRLFQIMKSQRIQAYEAPNGVVFVDSFVQKTVQVPIQDSRTKHLIYLFATQMKRIVEKYPKLRSEINGNLIEYFQQQLIDLIEVDQIDKLVQIVKYVPQVVKVQNVYAYSSQKSRKVEFHLRVLIKALLQQFEKIKIKSGVVPQLDEGVIGMIKQQIMEAINVDDILKVFRVVPKIVEVEKIVQKIVERVIQIPQVHIIERIVEKIVEVEKIKEVQRIVNVPLQIPVMVQNIVEKIVPIQNIIEKVVEVPRIIDRIVELKRQVPKIIEIQRFQEKIVEVDRIVEVQKIVNHIETEIKKVQLIRQKLVPIQRIVEKIIEVPVIVEKIVQRIVEIPKIIEVERIVQKIVPHIEYRNAREVQNHIQVQHSVVDRIVQKPIPIIQIVEKIVEVPQVIEKIVTLTHYITEIKEVQVIREKIVIEERIKQIEKQIVQIVEVIKQVPREIQRIVQIPIIHEVIVKVQTIIEKPIIRTVTNTIIKEVYIRQPIIIREPKIVEVETIVNHYIEVPRIVKHIEQKIVEVPRHIDRIKQVRVQIQKIIQKMVEVPKIVEVEKIVEKIVVVPRVIQKVVEVPRIVEKIVEKQIIRDVIRQVQRIVQKPVIQERIVEVEVNKNVYLQVEKVIDRVVQKIVEVPKYEEKIITHQVFVQKVVELLREVPKIIEVEKIVPHYHEVVQIVQVERPLVVPVEVPVPVQKIVEKIVPKQQYIERIVQVPQIMEKIVAIKQQKIQIKEVEKIVEKIVIDKQIKQVQRIVPYIQEIIKQIPTIVEKIVPITTTVQQIKTAQLIVEKIVEKMVTVTKIYEVQKIQQVLVQVPKFIEIEKIIPQVMRVNNYIQKIVQKLVQVPIVIEQLKQIYSQKQKIVQVNTQRTRIIQVQRAVEKVVILEKIKEVIRNVNHIQQILHIVDRYQQLPVQIKIHEERLIQVPYILEKIVEKIVVMPQIVEVLKYVHEVCESQDLGIAVGVDVAEHEQKYRALSQNLKGQLNLLSNQLSTLRNSSTESTKNRVNIIEGFLAQLKNFIYFPKIVKVPQQKIVEKQVQKIVRIPVQDERSLRMQLTLSMLVDKLIAQLKRIKNVTNSKLQLDEEIRMIFFAEFEMKERKQDIQDLNERLSRYSNEIYKKFENLGPWSMDHQLMLNSFLQQRFSMAQIIQNSNMEIERAQAISQKRLEGLRRYKNDKSTYQQFLQRIKKAINNCNSDLRTQIGDIYRVLSDYSDYSRGQVRQPMKLLSDPQIDDERIQTVLRQKNYEITQLRNIIQEFKTRSQTSSQTRVIGQQGLNALKRENQKLTQQINALSQKVAQVGLNQALKRQIKDLNQHNLQLEEKISQLTSALINLQNQMRARGNFSQFDENLSRIVVQSPERRPQQRDIVDRSAISTDNRSVPYQQERRSYGGRDYRQMPSGPRYNLSVLEQQRASQSQVSQQSRSQTSQQVQSQFIQPSQQQRAQQGYSTRILSQYPSYITRADQKQIQRQPEREQRQYQYRAFGQQQSQIKPAQSSGIYSQVRPQQYMTSSQKYSQSYSQSGRSSRIQGGQSLGPESILPASIIRPDTQAQKFGSPNISTGFKVPQSGEQERYITSQFSQRSQQPAQRQQRQQTYPPRIYYERKQQKK